MVQRLDDAIIQVKLDTKRAETELEEIGRKQRRIREERTREARETREKAEKRQRDDREDRQKTGLPEGVNLRSVIRSIPVVGTAFALEESGIADTLRGMVRGFMEEILQDLPGPVADLLRGLVDDALEASAVTRKLAENVRATEKTATDALRFGKGAALLGLDVDAEFVENFLSGTYMYNLSVDKMRRFGREKVSQVVTENLARTIGKGLGSQ